MRPTDTADRGKVELIPEPTGFSDRYMGTIRNSKSASSGLTQARLRMAAVGPKRKFTYKKVRIAMKKKGTAMKTADQSKFIAGQLSGISAVLLALTRALEEGGSLKREDLVAVLNEFRNDMTPDEVNSGEGFMIERFLDALDDPKLARFEYD